MLTTIIIVIIIIVVVSIKFFISISFDAPFNASELCR